MNMNRNWKSKTTPLFTALGAFAICFSLQLSQADQSVRPDANPSPAPALNLVAKPKAFEKFENLNGQMKITTANLSKVGTTARLGSGTSGGGDRVEPLFIQAQKDAISILASIHLEQVAQLPIQDYFKSWLKEGDRLQKIQFYSDAMSLNFQEEPFIEDGRPRGTGFDATDPNNPKMIISRTLNTQTSPDQAIALAIHEAGHFTGEMNHLFLSRLGVALEQMALPVVPCKDSNLRKVQPGFRCSVVGGGIFERVAHDKFGEAWKTPDGVIWSESFGWFNQSYGSSFCKEIGGALPSYQDFYRGYTNGFQGVLPGFADFYNTYWTGAATVKWDPRTNDSLDSANVRCIDPKSKASHVFEKDELMMGGKYLNADEVTAAIFCGKKGYYTSSNWNSSEQHYLGLFDLTVYQAGIYGNWWETKSHSILSSVTCLSN